MDIEATMLQLTLLGYRISNDLYFSRIKGELYTTHRAIRQFKHHYLCFDFVDIDGKAHWIRHVVNEDYPMQLPFADVAAIKLHEDKLNQLPRD